MQKGRVVVAGLLAVLLVAGLVGCPEMVTVPNMEGLSQAAAQSALTNAGLTLGTVTEQFHATVPPGGIISQSVTPGTQLREGRPVNLVISLGPPSLPSAGFSSNHISGKAPLIVQFEDQSTAGSSGITSWSWDFGDALTGPFNGSHFQNPSYVFNFEGTYTVTLTVSTPFGSSTTSQQIVVSPGGGEVLNPRGRVIDDIPTLSLDTVREEDYVFTYTGNGTPPMQPDDILVGSLPEGGGYLRLVHEVKSWEMLPGGAKSVTVSTQFCSLDQLVFRGELVLGGGDKALFPLPSFSLDLAGTVLYEEDFNNGKGNVRVEITTGTIQMQNQVDAELEFYVPWEDFSDPNYWLNLALSAQFLVPIPKRFKCVATSDLTLDFSVKASAAYQWSWTPPDIPIGPPVRWDLVGAIGPVPVWIAGEVSLWGGAYLNTYAEASVEAGFYSNSHLEVGGEYRFPADLVDLSQPLVLYAQGYGPAFWGQANASGRVYVKPQLKVTFYGAVSNTFGLRPYVQCDATVAGSQQAAAATIDLIAGIDGDFGFRLGIIDWNWFLQDHNIPIQGPSWPLFSTSYSLGLGSLASIPLGFGRTLEMREIRGGDFRMGEDGQSDKHWVKVPPFWMGSTELTLGQLGAANGYDIPDVLGTARYPAAFSWDEAKQIIAKLNAMNLGWVFSLPTEAQWEFACRAGSPKNFYWGEDKGFSDIGNYAWYNANSGGASHQVGLKWPNAFGLYDMSGNSFEWCEDDWHDNYLGAPRNGTAWVESPRSTHRVFRGGNHYNGASDCMSHSRGGPAILPDMTESGFGLRIVGQPVP